MTIEIPAGTELRDRALVYVDGGNADPSPEGWIHFYNYETRQEVRREHAAGRPFFGYTVFEKDVPLEAELRFVDLLDEHGWAVHVVEEPMHRWHWSASNAASEEIPQSVWHDLLYRAREETRRG